MNILYFNPAGGIAGDMIISALLDCGADEQQFLSDLRRLPLKGWSFSRENTKRGFFSGTHISFSVQQNAPERHLSEIKALIQQADYPFCIENDIIRTFELLAEAEAKAHGIDKNLVHFHETGADDTILDICGAILLFYQLNIDKIYSSPLPMGDGFTYCQHGQIPLPAPALNYLLTDVPVFGIEEQGETVTPTGIALLKALHCHFGPMPVMTVRSAGTGCGTRETKNANILRVFCGNCPETYEDKPTVLRLECTVDDMTGEEAGFLWDAVMNSGARDMYYSPVFMKKGRPAYKITVLCDKEILPALENTLFSHSTTLGFTISEVSRSVLPRKITEVSTPLGTVRFKTAEFNNCYKSKPEYEDIKKIALKGNISLKEARSLAEEAFKDIRENRNDS